MEKSVIQNAQYDGLVFGARPDFPLTKEFKFVRLTFAPIEFHRFSFFFDSSGFTMSDEESGPTRRSSRTRGKKKAQQDVLETLRQCRREGKAHRQNVSSRPHYFCYIKIAGRGSDRTYLRRD